MNVCVFGAGAVGGHVATRLLAARAADISVVARGPLLQAIRRDGFTLRSHGEEIRARPERATDDAFSLPPQDIVLVALKAVTLPAAADAIAHLIAPTGCAVFLLNGIPWWWRYGLSGGGSGPLPLVDPEAALWTRIGPERALGCVVYSPNIADTPGVIVHVGPNRFVIGEPDGSRSPRLRAVLDLFKRGGLAAEGAVDIRREIWRKLVINASGNPISALTRLKLTELARDPDLRDLMVGVAREVMAVAAAVGWDVRGDVDMELIASRAERKPDVRSSILQDVMLKRPLEIEAQLGQVQAFAQEAGVAVPTMDVLLPLLRGLDRALRER
jgi:2-dehydropantoate 2-reductase